MLHSGNISSRSRYDQGTDVFFLFCFFFGGGGGWGGDTLIIATYSRNIYEFGKLFF